MSGRGNPRPAQDFLGLLTLIQHTGDVWGVVSNPAAPTKSFSLMQYLLVNGLYCSAFFAFGFFLAVLRVGGGC